MKTILSLIFALGIITVFAISNSKIDNIPKELKKNPKVTNESKKLNTLTPCEQAIYDGIASCYGVESNAVCCINVGHPTYYGVTTSSGYYSGEITFTPCGKGCTQCCLYVLGNTQCCFTILYDAWPC